MAAHLTVRNGRFGSLDLPCAQSSPPADADGAHLRRLNASPQKTGEDHCVTPARLPKGHGGASKDIKLAEQKKYCWKCCDREASIPGLHLCQECSDELDHEIVDQGATDWVLTTVSSEGVHDRLYRNRTYSEAKKIWADWPDFVDSHFLRPSDKGRD